MVPPRSDRIIRVPPYSRIGRRLVPVRDRHPLRRAFPDASGFHQPTTGLVPVRSPLLGESLLMSFPPATEMFQFAGFASGRLCIQRRMTQYGPGFPIRISADQSLLATPRGFSQRATSFIASRCQGIHQVPLRRLIPASRTAANPARSPKRTAALPPRRKSQGTFSAQERSSHRTDARQPRYRPPGMTLAPPSSPPGRLPDESTSSFPIHDVLEHRRSHGSAPLRALGAKCSVSLSASPQALSTSRVNARLPGRPDVQSQRYPAPEATGRWWRRPDSNR